MTKVLVVDDTPDMARLMAMAVRAQGYEALVARNGPEALAIASSERPAVVLLDITMPHMNGIEVLRRLKDDGELRSVPVILVSAKDEDQDLIAGLDAGAHDYISKPFKNEILAARLRSAVRIRQNHERSSQVNEQLRAEIAERKRMEHELARVHKLESIGQLAAGIAHEINTPAQYVGDNTRFLREAFADMDVLLVKLTQLLEAAKGNAITKELLAEIDAAVIDSEVDYLSKEIPKAIEQSLEGIDRVANIVRAMKDFSHPGGDQKQLLDLNRAIQSTLTVSRNEWKYVAELVTDFDCDLPPVPCLAGDFNQVVLNLVVNAAHAIAEVVANDPGEKGTITVRTRRDGNWAEIRIEDTGTGIPEAICDRVFDHFFTTKEVGKGTGQGLTIAHSIVVRKHGGTIHFETEVGKGTSFVVRLPVTDQVGAPT